MKPLQILLANDDPVALRRLRETLEPKGYALIVATTDAEALEKVNRHHPDLVILDGDLPGRTHYQFMKALGGTGSKIRPRVLVLILKSFHHGLQVPDTDADLYLYEQAPPLELLAFVRRLIGSPAPANIESASDTSVNRDGG